MSMLLDEGEGEEGGGGNCCWKLFVVIDDLPCRLLNMSMLSDMKLEDAIRFKFFLSNQKWIGIAENIHKTYLLHYLIFSHTKIFVSLFFSHFIVLP